MSLIINKYFITLKLFPQHTINVSGRLIDLSTPCVMGILNVTPDSFYAGSRKQTEHDIAAQADKIIAEGGTIIDVGAFSTRPGAAQVTSEEEMSRLRMALRTIRGVQPEGMWQAAVCAPERLSARCVCSLSRWRARPPDRSTPCCCSVMLPG